MKTTLILFGIITALAMGGFAQAKVGSKVENFSLPDMDGKTQSLADLKGSKGVVLVFVSIQCPVVRGYNERINELSKAYKAKGINVIGVDANASEPTPQKQLVRNSRRFLLKRMCSAMSVHV